MTSLTAGAARAEAQSDALTLALALQDGVTYTPAEVVVAVEVLLARRGLGPEPRAVGHRAAARALRVLDRPQDAVTEARRSAAIAHRAGLTEREAEARLTLSLSLFQAGQTRRALHQIEWAETLATGHTARLASAQHGILLERLGRLDDALERYAAALGGPLPELDRAQVLNNRAIALAFAGRVDEAVADLEEAIGLARASGAAMPEAELLHNLGFALTVAGDLPATLGHFDDADALFLSLGSPVGLNLVARARALSRANLHREARTAARDAVAELEAGGASLDAEEARVLLAVAELEDGDAATALTTAGLARAPRSGARAVPAWPRWPST